MAGKKLTLDEFIALWLTMPAMIAAAERRAITGAAEIVVEDAKHRIGEYQEQAGPFAAWQPLSGATLDGFDHPLAGHIPGKTELGYAPPDNPLLRDGTMRDAIEASRPELVGSRVEAVVGVPHRDVVGPDGKAVDIGLVALWQECGTPNAMYPIPPRSFIGAAGFSKAMEVRNHVGLVIFETLTNQPIRNH